MCRETEQCADFAGEYVVGFVWRLCCGCLVDCVLAQCFGCVVGTGLMSI